MNEVLGLTAEEWQSMYHIAADRADKAEEKVKRLQTVVKIAKAVFYTNGMSQILLDELGKVLKELDKEE